MIQPPPIAPNGIRLYDYSGLKVHLCLFSQKNYSTRFLDMASSPVEFASFVTLQLQRLCSHNGMT